MTRRLSELRTEIKLATIHGGGGGGGGSAEVNDLSDVVTWASVPVAFLPVGTSAAAVAAGDHLHTGTYALQASAANWNTAFGWGDHASGGYRTGSDDPNWDTAFGWGDHAGLYCLAASATNWNTAFSWGDHAGLYCLIASAANWNTAFSWGDHSGLYALAASATNWNTAFGWGDHGAQGYITDYTVTEGDVTAHEAALSITESQISDLGSYITGVTKASVEAVLTGEISSHTHAGGGGVTASPGAFTLSGSHDITTTESTIPFDTEVFDPDTNYSNASGEITVTASGYYSVAVNVPINDDGTAGTTRGRVFGFLQKDATTSTWATVNHIRGQVYEREASGGTGIHAGGVVSLLANEVIRFRVDVSSTVDVSTESGEASLNIHKIRDA